MRRLTSIAYNRILLAGAALILTLASCGTQPISAPTATVPVPSATTVPQPSATSTPPAPTVAATATPVATTLLPTAIPAAPTAVPTVSQSAAVQTILAYYNNINQKEYEASYRLWANNGAASGQTLAQFTAGFTQTVQVDIQLGEPTAAADSAVTVPLTILSVVNTPGSTTGQTIEQYQGTYMLVPNTGGWHITSAQIAASSGTLPPATLATPESALQGYYAAIDQHALAQAFTYWSGNGQASQQTFEQFATGYAHTASATIALGKGQGQGAAGSVYTDIPSVVHATTSDGSQQTFCGTYTLRRSNVPPFDKLGWHIEGAKIAAHAYVAPGSPEEQQLLVNGCS